MAKSHTNVDYSSFSGASRRLIEVSGTTDTATYHAQINKRVQELEQEVRRIHLEISALMTCRNAAATTNRLPMEVLANIFYFVSRLHTCTDILNVSHVCGRWRSIVLDHPHFFTDLQGNIVLRTPLMETMIRMSGGAPLTYSWTGSKSFYGRRLSLDALNSALYDGTRRLKSFVFWKNAGDELDGDDEEHSPTWNAREVFRHWYEGDNYSHAPMLEKLSIMNIVVDGYYESDNDLPDKSDLKSGHLMPGRYRDNRMLNGGAPVLRDVTLSHIGVAWKSLPLGPSVVNLRLLEDHRFGQTHRPATSEFITSLRQMPQLQAVEFHNFLPRVDTAHVGKPFTFPSTLKTLKVTDDCKYLSHFLQITHVLDHVSIEVAFFQYEINATEIGGVLTYLKKAIGGNRANAGVTELVDSCGLSFQLSFGEEPEGGQGSEGYLAPVKVQCGLGRTESLDPVEYHLVLAKHFDISCLRILRLWSADLDIYGDDVWVIFNCLSKLGALVFHRTHFGSFINHLEPKDPSTFAEEPSSRRPCPFPALKKIIAISPTKPGPTALQGRDRSDYTSRFTDILNARKELGSPLLWIDFEESEVSEEVAEQLRKSVPGLVVYRSGEDD